MELLRLTLNGSRACLVRIGPNMRPDDTISTATDPDLDRNFAEDARLHNNAFSKAVDQMSIGSVLRHEELLDTSEMHRSAIYNELLVPGDIHSGILTKTLVMDSSYWFFDVSRSKIQESLSESDRELMAMLMPHFRRATEIGRSLELERRLFDTRALRFGAGIGLVTVDAQQRIKQIDAIADAILARPGCTMRRRAGRLEISGAIAAKFSSLVRQACRTGCDLRQAAGGEMVAKADFAHERAIDVLLSIGPALQSHRPAFQVEPAAVIAMRELSPELPAGFAATSAQTFQLTPKEAQVAALLAAGYSLQQAAASGSIGISTARGHLNQIFRKTNTHQQSALVALLRTIEPLVRPD